MELRDGTDVFQLRQANREDLDRILELLVQAAEWLQTKKTTQWDYYLTNLEDNTKEVQESIKNSGTYLVEHEGKAIATITLEDSPNDWDTDIWGEDIHDDGVVYLHRIVVHRDYAGRGIGKQLIDWAKKFVRDGGGKYIRFDCLGDNEGLNTYYQRHYPLKGIANIYGKHCKYELEL
ncbi:GNAT family N-acetyltransferase [Virgibacillus kekensis]|uniref:GNAT family N-acetyltransferase n=1 Tax=Virgibacillus kekensis TaxID=202261 RepID=A0ABV9DFD4_9BACI